MLNNIRYLLALGFLTLGFAYGAGQEKAARSYTKADFIKVDGGSLNERVERASRQFKSSNQGESVWIAYHFPLRAGLSIGPFTGMLYYDEGIRLERRNDPASSAVFLLTDVSGAQPRVVGIRTLDLSEPYVFENRPVYWLGDVEAGQSLTLLESTARAEKDDRNLIRSAIRAIAVHDSPRVVPWLKEAAAKETEIETQRAAISNLARIKSAESLDALIELYDTAATDTLKEEIISGLAREESRKAADKLVSIAKNDPDPKMRQRAIRRLK